MGVFDRLKRILSSSGGPKEEDEDPERTLADLMAQMRKILKAERLELAAAVRDLKRAERDMRGAEQTAATAQAKARESLAKGNEERARDHLRRKVESLELARSLEQERDLHRRTAEALRDRVRKVEDRIRSAQSKRRSLLARKRRLEAIERYRKRLPPELADQAISRALAQLRDRVEIMEITQDPEGLRSGADDELERRFAELEAEVAAEGGSLEGVSDLKRLLLEEDDEAESPPD